MSKKTIYVRRIEPAALVGVLVREIINFTAFWKSSAFSSIVNPLVYLLAFGFGFGSIISVINGHSYIDYLGTGMVAITVMFAGTFPAMYNVFVKYNFQHTYDAILSAPVDTEEIVTAEAIWIASRVAAFGTAPILVSIFFGLDPSWGMLLVPLIAGLSGLGWAFFGIYIAGSSKSIESFSYWQGAFLTPIFLVGGTFFPLDGLPQWAQTLGKFNPLWHCVELVRDAVFMELSVDDLWHFLFLIVFMLLAWVVSIRAMRKKLIL